MNIFLIVEMSQYSLPKLHRSGDPKISYMISNTYRVHHGVDQTRDCTPWVSPVSLYSLKNRRRGSIPNMNKLEKNLLRNRRIAHTIRKSMNGNKEVVQVRECSEWKNKSGGKRKTRKYISKRSR